MKFKKTLFIVVILFMFSSIAYAFTSKYIAKYDFDRVRLVPEVKEEVENSTANREESEKSNDITGITMEPINVSNNVWLRGLSDGNLKIIIGKLELTKENATGITEGYIEISGEKGSVMLLSNSFSNKDSYTMTQYWDFKRLENTSIVKGGDKENAKSALLFIKKGEGYAEYFLVGYLYPEIDHWTAEIPERNYYYAKIPDSEALKPVSGASNKE